MTDQGYISVHRRLRGNWVWKDKPFSKGQAWIDMLLKANHAGRKMATKGGFLEIGRGQFVRTEEGLANDFGWSRGKVRLFLKILESR